MQRFKDFAPFSYVLLAGSVVALAVACSSRTSSSTSGAYGAAETGTGRQPAAVVTTTDGDQNIAQLRTDETDTNPGNPRGDATSANPSEGESQGAGSRALVGQPSNRNTGAVTATGGAEATTGTSTQSQTSAAPSESSSTQSQGNANLSQGNANLSQGAAGNQTASAASTQGQTSTNLVIPLYKENLQVGKRVVDAGTVRVHKSVRTETVNQPVQLRTETVTIDRAPAATGSATGAPGNLAANQPSAAGQPFQDQDITIHLRREEPVVQKQVVPAGQIVAQTQTQLQQTNVQGQVRHEEISVDKGNAQNVVVSQNLNQGQGAGTAVGAASDVSGQGQGAGAGGREGNAITDVATLNSTQDQSALAGRQVQLSGVRVQAVVDPRLVRVGNEGEQQVFVRLPQAIPGLKEGSELNLTGTVRQPAQTTTTSLGLSGDAEHVLMQQPIYVDAQSARLTNNR